MKVESYDGKPFVVTIDRSTMERGYVLGTVEDDGSLTERNKPLKQDEFEFSPT
jgi:hypothetical protein